MITIINESKTLTKIVSCKCKCKFDGRKCNSNQKRNNDRCRCDAISIIYVKNIIFRILLHVCCQIGKYLASIIDNSVITCGEIIDVEETKAIPKNIICETKSFYVLLAVLLITTTLLIAVSIYYYRLKYMSKKTTYCHIMSQMIN